MRIFNCYIHYTKLVYVLLNRPHLKNNSQQNVLNHKKNIIMCYEYVFIMNVCKIFIKQITNETS